MYMDTDSFVYHVKTEDIYKDIAPDVDARFDTSNYPKVQDEKDAKYRPLEVGKNKKVLRKMKDELGGKIMIEFVAIGSKNYALK